MLCLTLRMDGSPGGHRGRIQAIVTICRGGNMMRWVYFTAVMATISLLGRKRKHPRATSAKMPSASAGWVKSKANPVLGGKLGTRCGGGNDKKLKHGGVQRRVPGNGGALRLLVAPERRPVRPARRQRGWAESGLNGGYPERGTDCPARGPWPRPYEQAKPANFLGPEGRATAAGAFGSGSRGSRVGSGEPRAQRCGSRQSGPHQAPSTNKH
jgi:hypothetical protein